MIPRAGALKDDDWGKSKAKLKDGKAEMRIAVNGWNTINWRVRGTIIFTFYFRSSPFYALRVDHHARWYCG